MKKDRVILGILEYLIWAIGMPFLTALLAVIFFGEHIPDSVIAVEGGIIFLFWFILGPLFAYFGVLMKFAKLILRREEKDKKSLSSDSVTERTTSLEERKGKEFCKLLKESLPNRFMNLSPEEFEKFICELFNDIGYKTQGTRMVGDYGADIIAINNSHKVAIQVKRYNKNNKVGVKEINQVVGAMGYYECDKAIVITTSSFTNAASNTASKNNVELWDWKKLYDVTKDTYMNGQEVYEYFKKEFDLEKQRHSSVQTSENINFEVVNVDFKMMRRLDDPKDKGFMGLKIDIKAKNLSDKKIYLLLPVEAPPIVIDPLGNQFSSISLWHDSFSSGYIYPHAGVIIKATWDGENFGGGNISKVVLRYRSGSSPEKLAGTLKEIFLSVPSNLTVSPYQTAQS